MNALQYAFLGPLVGALARAAAGKPCDRIGGGRITFWVFIAMSLGVVGVLYAIGMKGSPIAFPVFFASFLFLFAATGIGNASTFQMIPAIMRKEVARLEPGLSPLERVKQSDKEAAAIIGFTSAIAAYGAFFIPKSFGTSITATGGAAIRALRLPRLLPELHRHHLVVLHPAAAACCSTSSTAAAALRPSLPRDPPIIAFDASRQGTQP